MSTYGVHRSSGAKPGPPTDPPEPLRSSIASDGDAFPTLDAEDLRVLEALGDRRSVARGQYLYREGDASYDFFYAIVSGAVEIIVDSHGEKRIITRGRRPLPFETSYPGLFAVGDLRSGSTKRVAAAVGEGSAVVRSVHEHLAFGS